MPRRRTRDDWNEGQHHRTPAGSSGGGEFASGGGSGGGDLPDAHETVFRSMARTVAQAMASSRYSEFSSREVATKVLSPHELGFWGRLPGKTRVSLLKEETRRLLAEKPVSYKDAWDELFDDDQEHVDDEEVDDEDEEVAFDDDGNMIFDDDDEPQVIGVNDDGAALVFDEGAKWHRSADGYLAASPRIARTGIQVYKGWEMGVPDKETVKIYRPESEVFNIDSLRSYAHKPITNDHPKEAVTPANWRKYAVGQTADEILRDGGFIRIPITIMDENAIKDIEDGKRELSLGYTMELNWTPGRTEDGQSYDGVQKSIRANHLAIVASARGGKELRVGDSTGETTMSKKITVDGAAFEVDDAAAVVIPRHVERLEKGVADSTVALKTAQDKAATDAATIATLTAENATLKKKVEDAKLTPQQIELLVRDRATVVAQARAVLASVVTDGRELSDIRRQVVDAAMGAASKGWNEEQVASSFAVLTKDAQVNVAETRDGLSAALSNPRVNHSGQQALDAAYATYDKNLTEAWKKPVAA